MKAILIAEKPSQMREIQSVYNRNRNQIPVEIDFLSQAGHIMRLKMPKEIDAEKYGKWSIANFPEDYPYVYVPDPSKKDMLKAIKDAVTKGGYDFVIHAGDPDQEGELLVRLVLDYVKNPLPVKRFWTNDMTEGAVLGALLNLQEDASFDHLYEAALIRQHADYQFGMNVTGTVSCLTGDLCKLGRVKAPIISLLAKRELEIMNYVEKKTYKPAYLYKEFEFIRNDAFDTPEEAMKQTPATEYATVTVAKKEKKQTKAPKLFKLSTLQTAAHSAFGFSGAKTLEVLQSLYEAKAVSYPRTGCEYLSSQVDIGGIARKVLREVPMDTALLVKDPGDVTSDKTYCNDKAIAQEGHTAIIPTGQGLPGNATADQSHLYELIVRRFLSIFAAPKETMHIKYVAPPSGTNDEYIYTESYDIAPGYELVLDPAYEMKTSKGLDLRESEMIHPIQFFAKEVVSTKPSHYNDGSLIKEMDNPEKFEGEEGLVKYKIGTPATRAGIIAECEKNGYFKVVKGSFIASEKAIALYQSYQNVPLFMPVESGRWEEMLDRVRTGELDHTTAEDSLVEKMHESVAMLKQCKSPVFASSNSKVKAMSHSCPNCSSPVLVGQYGPYCSGKCGMTFGKVFGKEVSTSDWEKLLSGKKILLKNLTSKKTGRNYNAYIKSSGKVVEYSYTGKDGNVRSGKQLEFVIDGFEK